MSNRYPTDDGISRWSLFERILYANSVLKSKKKLIVFIYNTPDASTFRYRAYNIHCALEESDEIKAIYFYNSEIDSVINIILKADFVTIVRVPWNITLEKMMFMVKKKNIPLIFDCDDLIFDIREIAFVANTIRGDLENMINYSSKIYMAARYADFFTTTNSFLAKKIKDVFNKEVWIIPNGYNEEQFNKSVSLVENAQEKKTFKVGYFSGSPSHYNDLLCCVEEVKRFLDDFSETKFVICGYMELPQCLHELVRQDRVERLPFTDYLTLQEYIHSVDINIAPLIDNDFTSCKSELKFFEAALVKVPTLASPSYAFRHSIEHGKSGYLCKDSEWYNALMCLYIDKNKRTQVAEYAFNICASKYGPQNICDIASKVYMQILKRS